MLTGILIKIYEIIMSLGKIVIQNEVYYLKDYFVQMHEILMDGFKPLSENQKVEFEVGEGPKGPVAKQVTPL